MPDADVNYRLTGPNLGGTVTWVASPTLVNEIVFGYGLWTENQVYRDAWLAEVQRDKLGINLPQIYPDQNPLKLIPSLTFGSTNIGPNATTTAWEGRFPMADEADTWTFTDNLTKVWEPPSVQSRPAIRESALPVRTIRPQRCLRRQVRFQFQLGEYGQQHDLSLCQCVAGLFQQLYRIDQPHAVFAGHPHPGVLRAGYVEGGSPPDGGYRSAFHRRAATVSIEQSLIQFRSRFVQPCQSAVDLQAGAGWLDSPGIRSA